MLRVFDATARYVDQGGGKRRGAFAMYLEPWHADVFAFLDLKKNHGKEESRARDLFYALWVRRARRAPRRARRARRRPRRACSRPCRRACPAAALCTTSSMKCTAHRMRTTRVHAHRMRMRTRVHAHALCVCALQVPDLFMRRVEQGGKWSFFCPNEAP